MARRAATLKATKESARKRALARKLRESFERIADTDKKTRQQRTRDFVFHMIDWEEDLLRLARFYEAPSSFSPREARKLLAAFLIHVPNHLAQAARLAELFTDIFADEPIIGPSGRPGRPHAPARRR